TSDGFKPRPLILRRSPLCFIGGNAVINPLIVNFSNRRCVICGGGTNVYAVHVRIFGSAFTPVQLRRSLHRNPARKPAALRATPAWRTSLVVGIFGLLASRTDRPMSSERRAFRLSQDREMPGPSPLLLAGFSPSISSSSATPKPG